MAKFQSAVVSERIHPTQVPTLWFHSGNLHQSRHYPRFPSMQFKAHTENIPTPVGTGSRHKG